MIKQKCIWGFIDKKKRKMWGFDDPDILRGRCKCKFLRNNKPAKRKRPGIALPVPAKPKKPQPPAGDTEANTKYLAAMKLKGCSKCKEIDPKCLDVHHLNPKDKKYHTYQMLKLPKSDFLAELSKCVILCANCHRKAHHKPTS